MADRPGLLRRFLDIGTGLPTASNTHEVAQALAPESRIVYVDNDPVVICHAQALLTSSPQGQTDYLHADLRDTAEILAGAARTGATCPRPRRARCSATAASAASRRPPANRG